MGCSRPTFDGGGGAGIDFERHRVPQVCVRLVDERLTTVSAHRDLHAAGLKERSFRGIVDQAAAVVILEQAITTERMSGVPAGERVHPIKRGRA